MPTGGGAVGQLRQCRPSVQAKGEGVRPRPTDDELRDGRDGIGLVLPIALGTARVAQRLWLAAAAMALMIVDRTRSLHRRRKRRARLRPNREQRQADGAQRRRATIARALVLSSCVGRWVLPLDRRGQGHHLRRPTRAWMARRRAASPSRRSTADSVVSLAARGRRQWACPLAGRGHDVSIGAGPLSEGGDAVCGLVVGAYGVGGGPFRREVTRSAGWFRVRMGCEVARSGWR